MKKLLVLWFLAFSCSAQTGFGDLLKLKNKVGGSSGTPLTQEAPAASSGSKAEGISAVAGLFKEESIEEELSFGKGVAAQILGAARLHPDEKIQKYLNLVGRYVASHSERPDMPWTFALIDSSAVNAFAAPGGYVLVTTGLYNLLGSEDELAAVLAHEIVHVNRKHYFNMMKKQKLIAFGAGAIAKEESGQLGKQLANMGGQIFARGLDKTAEYEADRDGMILAARSGYDSSALVAVLDKIEAQGKRDNSAMTLLFATHPSPADRKQELIKIASQEIEEAAVPSRAQSRIQMYKAK